MIHDIREDFEVWLFAFVMTALFCGFIYLILIIPNRVSECQINHHKQPYVLKEKITDLDGCGVYKIHNCDSECYCSILYVTSCRGSVRWSERQGKSTIEKESLTAE